MPDLGANIALVRARIAHAAARGGRSPDSVTLVAVTKTVSVDRIREAMVHGLRIFGENRVQEAREKVPQIPEASWHLIGSLQRNKVKEALGLFHLIHSVDSVALAEEIGRRALAGGAAVQILIQVNISEEPQKHGVPPQEAAAVVGEVARIPGVRVRGLMGMAPVVATREDARPFFRRLREIRDRVRDHLAEVTLPDLSMGMSDDFEIAIEEGATMVRVGRAVFG
jgi:PLP dependent protein